MISIMFNGTKQQINQETSVQALIDKQALSLTNIALVRNQQVLPQQAWQEELCQDGDNFVVFSMVAGG